MDFYTCFYILCYLIGSMIMDSSSCPSFCLCSGFSVTCSNKKISEFPENIPKETKQLFLGGNKISVLRKHKPSRNNDSEVSSLSKLIYLDLSNNKLAVIKADYFNRSRMLEELFLSNNVITKINPKAFANLEKLKTLKLDRNRLIHLPTNIRLPPSLTVLNLSQNELVSFQKEIIFHIHSLIHIDLSSNLISKLQQGLFENNKKLATINLQNNTLLTINQHIFAENMLSLNKLLLKLNNFICDCQIIEFRKWMLTKTEVTWTAITAPTCSEPTNLSGQSILNLKAADVCRLAFYKILSKRDLNVSHFESLFPDQVYETSKEENPYKSNKTMTYDPMVGIYTAAALLGMLGCFLLCMLYYKVKAIVVTHYRTWKGAKMHEQENGFCLETQKVELNNEEDPCIVNEKQFDNNSNTEAQPTFEVMAASLQV